MLASSIVDRPRGPGRPREFNLDAVLVRAADVFSERGYHGTSINDLAAATGLSAGSLYKAFADKRAVFLATVEHQSLRRGNELSEAIDSEELGLSKLRAALMHYAAISCGADGRKGCLVVSTAVELAASDDEIARLVKAAFRRREVLLAGLVRQGQADGSVDASIDVAASARFLLSLMQGLRVVGKSMPTRSEMKAAVDVALRALQPLR